MAKFAVEVAGPRNESIIFSPTRTKVRGRWDNSKTLNRDRGEAMKKLSMAAPVIPGKCILLDTDARAGEIFDPLKETPQGETILKAIQQVYHEHPMELGQRNPTGHPKESYKLTTDDVKTWAFCMRTLLDTGKAVLVAGSAKLPTVDEIRKWPGRRRRDPLNDGSQRARSAEEERLGVGLYPWADEVPEGGELVGAAAESAKK